jgi:phosphatidylinositol alpha-1,6-mannosyltransferase
MAQPLRVLMLTPDFPPALGGIQVVSHRLVASAPRLNPVVVSLAGTGDVDFDAGQSFPVHRAAPLGLPQPARVALLNARGLWEGLSFRPQVVLSMHIVTSPAAAALSRLLSTPVVQYLHADEMRVRPRLTRAALKRPAAVVAVSGHTEKLALAAGADPGRLRVIPNGVDLPQAPSASRSKTPLIVTVARLTQAYKGHDVMLRALPELLRRVPDTRWVVVGDGPLRASLEGAAAGAGLANAVEFVGAVPAAERDAWLDRAWVFAMPSRLPPGGLGGEGFGIAYLEAAAHGVPALAGNVGGALDAVEHERTGLLVDPADPHAVAGALADLLLDRQLRETLGRAGAERAREFAWPEVARRLEDLLLEVAR